jgi:hypothetical protein
LGLLSGRSFGGWGLLHLLHFGGWGLLHLLHFGGWGLLHLLHFGGWRGNFFGFLGRRSHFLKLGPHICTG